MQIRSNKKNNWKISLLLYIFARGGIVGATQSPYIISGGTLISGGERLRVGSFVRVGTQAGSGGEEQAMFMFQ